MPNLPSPAFRRLIDRLKPGLDDRTIQALTVTQVRALMLSKAREDHDMELGTSDTTEVPGDKARTITNDTGVDVYARIKAIAHDQAEVWRIMCEYCHNTVPLALGLSFDLDSAGARAYLRGRRGTTKVIAWGNGDTLVDAIVALLHNVRNDNFLPDKFR